MGYFPFFVELSGKRGLIIGGGAVALRKTRQLLPYGPELTVVSPSFRPEFETMDGVRLLRRPFAPEDVENCDFVIAASGDRAVNRQAAALCRERRILVDVADGGGDGSFVFPALVKQGDLSVGISTGGQFPLAGVYIKDRLAELLPERIDEILSWLCEQRAELKARYPEKRERDAALAALCRQAMELGCPPDGDEKERIIAAAEEEANDRGT